nr:hypothetical protein [Tanacetum cinerariifolium]
MAERHHRAATIIVVSPSPSPSSPLIQNISQILERGLRQLSLNGDFDESNNRKGIEIDGDFDESKPLAKYVASLLSFGREKKDALRWKYLLALMLSKANCHFKFISSRSSSWIFSSQYKDAKTLFEAIEARFGDNDTTKKTQRTFLKQMYENFNAPRTESLDSIFNRIQKIVSQLAILGENISHEDLYMKFLRSLPSEWNTHVVVWRNKADLDTMSIDDLYNNFRIVE